MKKSMKKNRLTVLVLFVCFVLCSSAAFAKSAPEMVKQEAGYYYGFAKGETLEEASLAAKRDLVSNALTTTLRMTEPKAASVNVSESSAKARLADVKPYVQSKPKASPAVTYRMKTADWDKAEKEYQETLRSELSGRAEGLLNKKGAVATLSEAAVILSRLADEGETELLTLQASGTELISRKVESVCAQKVKSLAFTLSTKDGFVDLNTQFSIKAADDSGAAVAGLTLLVLWEVPALPTDAAVAVPDEVRATVTTDALGTASLEYPVSADYHNRPVMLTVSTALSLSAPSSAALKKIDASSSVDACYVQYDDRKSAFVSYAVPAGKFNAGAVAQDTRAMKKEASHSATTGSYAIDEGLVTNAKYAAFLFATHAETMPEFFDNSDYNQGNQPVVGVSVKDAEAYASWLSEQTGCTYRLPTEEEWEKAARAGKETIYPWGDDSPAEAKKANYKGNGTYTGPSPVGAFESGKNEWGLSDMAGNVWEWTSTVRSIDPASTLRTVKGGSWMDGPAELRISNFREIDGEKGYPDVGFRLVMEVSK